MTKKQKKILLDAGLSSDWMDEVDHYLKDVNAALSGTAHEKEAYINLLCNDIADYVDDNPNATINGMIGELGTPETHADTFLVSKTNATPENIRKRMSFQKIVLITAVIVVTIVGIVYACALIENHKDAKSWSETEIRNITEYSQE